MTVLFVLMSVVLIAVSTVILGEKTGLPWPALTTLATTVFVFIPGTPDIQVPPELILPLFLPPLLWTLARRTSWGVIREQWINIAVLSVILVLLTMFAVGAVIYAIIPTVGFAAAIVMGAAVAPPDPVAVESVAEPSGIPRRILSALQSEGLFNDAASIVGFHLALAAVTDNKHVGPWRAAGDFIYAVIAAIMIALAIARFMAWLVEHVEERSARNALIWVVPFVTYILAEQVHASGVIAVVVAGIELNSRASIEAEDRLASISFWETVDVLFTAVAFGLIGLTVSQAIADVGKDLWFSVAVGVVIALTAIAVRIIVLCLLMGIYRLRGRHTAAPTRWHEVLLMSWSGMRGLVTLALVLSMPYAFPARREFAVMALTVLLVTMVIPGLLLPWLMDRLRISTAAEIRAEKMRQMAIRRARDAAARVVQEHYDNLEPDVSSALRNWVDQQMSYTDFLGQPAGESKEKRRLDRQDRARHADEVRRAAHAVRREAVQAAQEALLSARQERGMNPMVVDEVLKEIDRIAVLVNYEQG